ncbi:hypothetical protein ICN42_01980 [Polynucleobacter sp. 71A-WALBACH]|uniref:hypothetical protein n=1 Tax=Polynucleobacter sp. 71A-WALBACH TaxID=2689097 RepID=UPI001C0E2BB8|nr:hypothetical protein [Polynucleobacter sp. 71A-WALBACH]MBU3592868.1 hypothetical protein [Polynucleobacter sp. 71A-WALBACH]
MSNTYTKEAPYHPGYEDASFKQEISKSVLELSELRRVNARYLKFADAIVDFCKASHVATKKVTTG